MLFKPKDIMAIAKHIQDGAVGIFPCDTVYGLISKVGHAQAKRIREIKGKKEDSPLVVLLPEPAAITPLGIPVQTHQQRLFDQHWPGPYTFILDTETPGELPVNQDGSIGIRCPEYLPLNFLLDSVGEALISSSVNRHGEPHLEKISQLDPSLRKQVDFCFEDVDPYYQDSSHIWDIRQSEPIILRQGPST